MLAPIASIGRCVRISQAAIENQASLWQVDRAMLIRGEQPTDADGIRAVVVAAFPTAAEATLVDALRAAGHLTVSLVAEIDREIVGHIALSPVTTGESIGGVGLAPLSVHPHCKRQRIGGALVQAALAACRELGCGFVVVLGDPAYYARFGFVAAADWQLTDEYGGGDAFQAIELREDACSVGPQVVRYGPEFSVFG